MTFSGIVFSVVRFFELAITRMVVSAGSMLKEAMIGTSMARAAGLPE